MATSWSDFFPQCKSRLSAIARSLFLGRVRLRRQIRKPGLQRHELLARVKHDRARIRQLEADKRELQARNLALETEAATPRPWDLPLGDIPKGQQYGVGLIVLCVNLARMIGLRPAVRALGIFFAWLNVSPATPTYQTIRIWMQRLGLDRMQTVGKTDGGVWLTDHGNQIGKDKALIILRARDWKPGAALRLEDLDMLLVQPGESWKREDVGAAHRATAERCGTPRAAETDGAVELRDPVETLGTPEKKPLTIRLVRRFQGDFMEAAAPSEWDCM